MSNKHTLTPRPEAKANARLIAAAPDLLEALKAIIKADEDWSQDKDRLWAAALANTRAAKAKAEVE